LESDVTNRFFDRGRAMFGPKGVTLRKAWVLLWVPLAACGGGGGGGSTPTPTVTSITITGPEGPYLVSASYTFSASVTLSNGQTQAASGTWGSDAPAVGTMSNGVFSGVGSGEVTIWIDVTLGGRATKRLRVHPSYNGTWIGSYRITSCTDSGQMRSAVEFCKDIFTAGRLAPLGLFMSQNGLSVATTVFLGDLELSSPPAVVSDDGRLQVTARLTEAEATVDATLLLHQPQTTSIGGTITQDWRPTNLTGTAHVTGDLVDVAKSAGAALAPMGTPVRSFEEMLRAVAR
jgi:hypothetical protein